MIVLDSIKTYPKCLDCNKNLKKYTSKRCQKCSSIYNAKHSNKAIGKRHGKYKHGLSTKVNNCLLCYKIISWRAKKCLSCQAKTRDFNPNYKNGGKCNLNKLIRGTENYINWRKACFERDNYTCQDCKEVGGILNVDHIKPFYIIIKEFLQQYKQFSRVKDKLVLCKISITYKPFWNLDNGRTLCKSCHKVVTKKQIKEGFTWQ